MKITGGRILRFLNSPDSHIIGLLVFGPDRGLVKERAQTCISAWGGNMDDAFSSTVLTADDLMADPARLADEMSALSMFGDQRLIRVRLDHERPGAALAKLVRQLDVTPDKAAAKLVIEGGDMTPRSAVRKAFEAAGNFAAIGCYADSAKDTANLITTKLGEFNISIAPDALDMWVPLLQGDRALLRNEIDKMITFKGAGEPEGARVSQDDVRKIASGGQAASIDDIIMSAMSGDIVKCDDSFQRATAAKINSAVILRALQRHIARLLEAHGHMQAGQRPDQAMKALRPPVFRMQERTFQQHLNLWPSRTLARSMSQSLSVEEQVKSAGAQTDALVGRLLIALASFANKRS